MIFRDDIFRCIVLTGSFINLLTSIVILLINFWAVSLFSYGLMICVPTSRYIYCLYVYRE